MSTKSHAAGRRSRARIAPSARSTWSVRSAVTSHDEAGTMSTPAARDGWTRSMRLCVPRNVSKSSRPSVGPGPIHDEADPWGSRSMTRVRRADSPSAPARLTVVAVLPQPPLRLIIAMVRIRLLARALGCPRSAVRHQPNGVQFRSYSRIRRSPAKRCRVAPPGWLRLGAEPRDPRRAVSPSCRTAFRRRPG